MIDPDERLALAYAPARLRKAYAALLAFDAALGQAFKATNQAGLIAIRLAWWRDQLVQSTTREPVLDALHKVMQDHDVTAKALTIVIDGWAVLLDDPPYADAQLMAYARLRGGGLFALAAQVAGCPPHAQAGLGWALTDFARHCSHRETAERALILAQQSPLVSLPKPMRPFGLLAHFAQSDCQRSLDKQRAAGSPYRMIQSIGFVLFRR